MIDKYTTVLREQAVEVRVTGYEPYRPATFERPAEGGEFDYTLHDANTGDQLDWEVDADEDLSLFAEYQSHLDRYEAANFG